MTERKTDYPTGNPNGMSFICNRWVFTGPKGYRVESDGDDAGLFRVVRYNGAATEGVYGGSGLTEDAAHAMAERLAGGPASRSRGDI